MIDHFIYIFNLIWTTTCISFEAIFTIPQWFFLANIFMIKFNVSNPNFNVLISEWYEIYTLLWLLEQMFWMWIYVFFIFLLKKNWNKNTHTHKEREGKNPHITNPGNADNNNKKKFAQNSYNSVSLLLLCCSRQPKSNYKRPVNHFIYIILLCSVLCVCHFFYYFCRCWW